MGKNHMENGDPSDDCGVSIIGTPSCEEKANGVEVDENTLNDDNTVQKCEDKDNGKKNIGLTVDPLRRQKQIEALEEKYKILKITTDYDNKISDVEEKLTATLKEFEKKAVESDNLSKICDLLRNEIDEGCNSSSTHEILSETLDSCTKNSCAADDDQHKLRCSKCSRLVHYKCTDLPMYQLSLFLTSGYQTYMCVQCTEIPQYVKDIYSTEGPEARPVLVDQVILKSFDDLIESRFIKMESRLARIIDEKLKVSVEMANENKISEESNQEHSVLASPPIPTYASQVLKIPEEVKKIILETQKETKVEAHEQERRENNFIIHGADEIGDSANEIRINDIYYIDQILEYIQVDSRVRNAVRLGRPKETRNRTLKAIMNSKYELEKVMSNLRKLKGSEDEFGRIKVTYDYTRNEREQIRQTVKAAEQKSAGDKERIYKVRGDPKNGLRIVSFPRIKPLRKQVQI